MTVSDRRRFLRVIGPAGLALALAGRARVGECQASTAAPAARPKAGKSRVIVARRPGSLLGDGGVNQEQVSDLIGKGICALLDVKDPVDGWKRLFRSDDRVGIKVNTLGGKGISPKPQLAQAICRWLQVAGVRPDRIIIWDRFSHELRRAGYEIVTSGLRPRCFGTDAVRNRGFRGYDREPEICGTIGSCFSSIISTMCTAMINLGVLKDHDLSGVSLGMKNLFGLIHNPNRYHFDVSKDPYLPDLASHPYVRRKTRLVIIDGLTGQYDGGPAYKPQYAWPYEGLLMGTDVVAVDRVGCTIIETKRKEAGLLSLAIAGREPKYIDLAEEKGLGYSDPSKIEIIEVS